MDYAQAKTVVLFFSMYFLAMVLVDAVSALWGKAEARGASGGVAESLVFWLGLLTSLTTVLVLGGMLPFSTIDTPWKIAALLYLLTVSIYTFSGVVRYWESGMLFQSVVFSIAFSGIMLILRYSTFKDLSWLLMTAAGVALAALGYLTFLEGKNSIAMMALAFTVFFIMLYFNNSLAAFACGTALLSAAVDYSRA